MASGEQRTDHVSSDIFRLSQRRLQSIRAASIASLVLIILQTVAGILSGSVCVTADAGRLFADFIEQHKYSQIDTVIYRRIELTVIFSSAILLTIINIYFILLAVINLQATTFTILESWMLIGTILSLTTNSTLLFVHFKSDWSGNPNHSRRITILWRERRAKVLHGLVNHGFGVTILIVLNGYFVADAIGTFIVVIFSFCNLASAVLKVKNEYKTFKFFQESYESIPD